MISLPALRAIRTTFAGAHLAVLVRRELASFFDGARWISEVIPYSVGRGARSIADQLRIAATIRAGRFDLAVLFPRSFQAALWAALAGVPRRVGLVGDARSPLLTIRARPAPELRDAHQSQHWLRLVTDTIGAKADAAGCALEPHEPHRIAMAAWLRSYRRRSGKPLIALAIAAAYGPAKEWPVGRYVALIDLLADRYEAECVLVGSPAERAKCAQAAFASKNGAIIASGETGVGELIALLSLCDGFAGNDSGSMHVAGALGIPTVGIFGSTDPMRTGPLGPKTAVIYHRIECSPCLARTCRFGHYNCLNQIETAEVADALERLGAFA